MAVSIKTYRKQKILFKKFAKDLIKIIKYNPNINIGFHYDRTTKLILDELTKFKKIRWNSIKIFNLVEKEENSENSFYEEFKNEFVSKINIQEENFINLYKDLDSDNKKLYFNDSFEVDVMVFGINESGEFLNNNDNSEITFINKKNKTISPGIKSIVKASKIYLIALDENLNEIIKTINLKEISSKHFYTLLNIHEDISLWTTFNVFHKRNINKSYLVKDEEKIIDKVLDENYQGPLYTIKNSELDSLEDDTDDVELKENDDVSNDDDFEEEKTTTEESVVDDQKDVVDENFEIIDEEYGVYKTPKSSDYLEEQEINENQEIESSLFNSNEMNDLIESKMDEMNRIKSLEEFIEQHKGTDEEIAELDKTKNNLEQELIILEEKLKNENKEKVHPFTNTENVVVLDTVNEITPVNVFSNEINVLNDYPSMGEYASNIGAIDSSNLQNYSLENKLKFLNNNFGEETSSAEELEKIIAIKEETLKIIDLLIQNNRLAMEQQQIKTKNINNIPLSFEKVRSLHVENNIKLTYSPGLRPTPLLMVYDTPNQEQYDRTLLEMIDEYKTNMTAGIFNYSKKHLWNMGAYISYDEITNEIELFAFNNFSNLLYLLRYINKPLTKIISNESYLILKSSLDELEGEIITTRI